MPGYFHQSLNRRSFLIRSTSTVATVALLGSRWAGAQNTPEPRQLRLALLSDTHIPADCNDAYRGFKPCENLAKVVPEVIAARPEAVIINGDAARLTGERNDYHELKSRLEPMARQAPIIIGLGNHDNREHFFQIFEERPGERQSVAGRHVTLLKHPAVRILILDSLLYVNQTAGLLGRNQRNWLAQFLSGADTTPVVLFIHHTLNDGDGDLLDVDRLFRLLDPFPTVKAIFYGHSHQYQFSQRQGVHLVNIPAVGYNFSDSEPVGWIDATFDPRGVDLKLNAIAGNLQGHGKTTRINWLG